MISVVVDDVNQCCLKFVVLRISSKKKQKNKQHCKYHRAITDCEICFKEVPIIDVQHSSIERVFIKSKCILNTFSWKKFPNETGKQTNEERKKSKQTNKPNQ